MLKSSYVYLIVFIIILFFNSSFANIAQGDTSKSSDSNIVWKHGVAFINSKAIYFDPNKLTMPEMFVSRKHLTNKILARKSIPAAKLIWLDGYLTVYDVMNGRIRRPIPNSRMKFIYKIKNQTLFLKDEKAGTQWVKVYFKLLDEKSENTQDGTIYYWIHLKCKWFDNVYKISGPPHAG